MTHVCDFVNEKGETCGMKFDNDTSLNNHIAQKHKVSKTISPRVICEKILCEDRVCGMSVPRKSLKDHDKRWHTEVKCKHKDCPRKFPHNQLMIEHYKDVHQKNGSCKNRQRCGFKSNDRAKIIEHEKTCNLTPAPPPTPTLRKDPNYKDNVCQAILKSGEICGRLVSPSYQQRHTNRWHSNVKCKYESCEKHFQDKQSMLDHYYDDHQKYFRCKTKDCNCNFKDKNRCAAHEETCNPNQKIICGYEGCEKQYSWGRTLLAHLYLDHNLNVLDARAYLGDKIYEDDDDESDDSESEEEEESATAPKVKRWKGPQVPKDKESGAQFGIFHFGRPDWHFEHLDYDVFAIFYHHGLRVPIFTIQLLYPELYSASNDDKITRPNFRQDRGLLKVFRRGANDYKDTSFHKGHLVRYCDYSKLPIIAHSTCVYSNALPMYPNFNLSVWKRLENHAEAFAKVHTVTLVVSVGLFTDPVRTEGRKHLPVPNKFAKILLGQQKNSNLWDMDVFEIPHNESNTPNTPLSAFLGNRKEIEKQLRLTIFPELKTHQYGVIRQKVSEQQSSVMQLHHNHSVIDII